MTRSHLPTRAFAGAPRLDPDQRKVEDEHPRHQVAPVKHVAWAQIAGLGFLGAMIGPTCGFTRPAAAGAGVVVGALIFLHTSWLPHV